VLRFYWLESEFRVDKFRALLALSDPDTVGGMHKLLTRFVDSPGNSERLTTVTQDICDEICRLAGLGQSKNVMVFVKGVLHGTVEKPILDLMAHNLRVFRMSKQRSPSPNTQGSGPNKLPPLPTTESSTPIRFSAHNSVAAYNYSDLKRFPTGSQFNPQKRAPIASELGRTMIPYQPVLSGARTQANRASLETIQRQFAQEVPFPAPISGAPNQTQPPKLWDDQASTTSHETSRSITVKDAVVTRKRGQLRYERRHDPKPKRKKTKP
jgi:hypothetical protein